MAASMVAGSSARGPMCRSAKGTPCSRSVSEGRWVMCASRQDGQGGTPSPSVRARASGCLRDSPRPGQGFPRRRITPPWRRSLSRGVSPARSGGLRDSGEDLLLRRPAFAGTLPRWFGDCGAHSSPTTWNCYPMAAPARASARARPRGLPRRSAVGALRGEVLDRAADSSRIAPETAMPNTPWPPRSRSTTSSGELHS